jgi:hypothetical protein
LKAVSLSSCDPGHFSIAATNFVAVV